MNSTRIAAILALVCIFTGAYMILDSVFFCLMRVTERLIVAHELAERFTKLPGGGELEDFLKGPDEEHFSTILHNLAYGDRTLYIIIGSILLITGILGLLSLVPIWYGGVIGKLKRWRSTENLLDSKSKNAEQE